RARRSSEDACRSSLPQRRAGRSQRSVWRLQAIGQWPRARHFRLRGISRSEGCPWLPDRLSGWGTTPGWRADGNSLLVPRLDDTMTTLSRKIVTSRLTTCDVAEDGQVVRLNLINEAGYPVSLEMSLEHAEALVMTLPRLLSQ